MIRTAFLAFTFGCCLIAAALAIAPSQNTTIVLPHRAGAAPPPPPPTGSCPFSGAGYPDGCAAAPVATIQFPTLLNGYAVRPPWNVAGVDYAVGIPSGTVLKDPMTATLPTGCSRNTSSFQITCSSGSPTLDSWDFSKNGGWQAICDGDTLTVTNSNFERGTNAQDMLVMVPSCASMTATYNKFDAHSITGGFNGNVFCNVNSAATCTFMYNDFRNASLDFIDVGTLTSVTKYNLFSGPGGGNHSDWFQTGGAAGLSNHITYGFNTVNQTPGTGSQGVGFGFNPNGNLATSEAAFNTTVAPSGANVSYHYGVDPTQTTGAITIHDNWAAIVGGGAFGNNRFALPRSSCNPCSGGGTSIWSNNHNMNTGALFSNNP